LELVNAQLLQLMRPGTLQLPALPPLALYVHLPWCLRKCPYCDFNSHERQQGLDDDATTAYLAALRADLEAALPLIWGRWCRCSSAGARPACLRRPPSRSC
jgi:oxygen-independent coproporphyrinogen-3 oxidase